MSELTDAEVAEIQRHWTSWEPVMEVERRAQSDIAALISDRASLIARVKELELALTEFARFGQYIAKERQGWDHDGFLLLDDERMPPLTMAPFRRAASALKGEG